MKVQDVMTRTVESCRPDADLAAAAMVMWRNDCGVVPVVDDARRVIGVITDRDICMAVATRHVCSEKITVGDVIGPRVHTVRPQDSVRTALERMRTERVRRLPVVDAGNQLVAMLSINDLILHATPGRGHAGVNAHDLLDTLKAIGAHGTPESSEIECEAIPVL